MQCHESYCNTYTSHPTSHFVITHWFVSNGRHGKTEFHIEAKALSLSLSHDDGDDDDDDNIDDININQNKPDWNNIVLAGHLNSISQTKSDTVGIGKLYGSPLFAFGVYIRNFGKMKKDQNTVTNKTRREREKKKVNTKQKQERNERTNEGMNERTNKQKITNTKSYDSYHMLKTATFRFSCFSSLRCTLPKCCVLILDIRSTWNNYKTFFVFHRSIISDSMLAYVYPCVCLSIYLSLYV